MEIQQGNYISQEAVSQLKSGMTKDQVRFVLGTPLVADIFHEDRWDYVYQRQRQNASADRGAAGVGLLRRRQAGAVEGDVCPLGAARARSRPGAANESS